MKILFAAALLALTASTTAHADQFSKHFVDNWCAESVEGDIRAERMSNVETECEGDQQGMEVTRQGYSTGGMFCRFTSVKLIGKVHPKADVAITIKCPHESSVKARMSIGRGHLVITPLHGVLAFPRM